MVQAGSFRRAAAFWPSWNEMVIEYKLTVGEAEVSKEDERFFEICVMADGLDIGRKEMIAGGTVGALNADQHALHRWYQRQPCAVTFDAARHAAAFESALVGLLPDATLMAALCGIKSRDSIPCALPIGDGLLFGYCVYRSNLEAGENPIGIWRRIRSGKPIEAAPSVYVGTGDDNGGGQFFVGATFYGPDEIIGSLGTVRRELVSWRDRHAAALDFRWLADSVLENKPQFQKAQQDAADDLGTLMCGNLWQHEVVNRGSNAILTKAVKEIAAKGGA